VLNYGGNLLDAIFVATRGALQNTRIPKCRVEESQGIFDFEIGDEETEIIEGWREMPVCVTVNKIGNSFILDSTPLEDNCSEARLMVSINRKGQICSVQKDGTGAIEPTLLTEMIRSAQTKGKLILNNLDLVLSNEEKRIENLIECVGFC
ncbi:Exosome complex component RRP42, partial [Lobulomyces angularis]